MNQNDKEQPLDQAAEKELEGVPEHLRNGEPDPAPESEEDALALLRADLERAKQDVLYAQAETQNLRRRMEKDISDARNYAATGFARDILSVSDNMARALEAIPADMREDERVNVIIAGIEATQRELDRIFTQHGITRIASIGLPLDPNQHQAMMEIPVADQEPGTIVQEMQSGYMIKDRLLRPAMVGVARKPD